MKTRKLTMSALFTAMVCVATLFIHLPVPMTGGYVHIGDALIYLAATMMPMPYAIASAVVGAGLADAMGGYYVYIFPTAIIKMLMVLPLSSKSEKIVSVRNVIGLVAASAIGLAGYFVADWIIYGNMLTALANLIAGLIQPLASAVVFIMAGYALDKTDVRNRLKLK